ncbi:dual specificity protein phosphatase family protein [Synechococcus sp. MIT S9510]
MKLNHRYLFNNVLFAADLYCPTIASTEASNSMNSTHSALTLLKSLQPEGPVFVHCVAAMERSPLVCMAWLVEHKHLPPTDALEYLMQLHPGTNPLPQQSSILRELQFAKNRSEDQLAA